MTRIFSKQKRPASAFIGQSAVILSIIAALLFGLGVIPAFGFGLITGGMLMKGLPVFLLFIFALMKVTRIDVALLAAGLLAHTVGDVLITGDVPGYAGTDALKAAIWAFGAGHLFYSLLFVTNLAPSQTLTAIRLQIGAVFWAIAGYGIYWFWPQITIMDPVFLAYSAAILIMTTFALLSRYSLFMAGLGALLFLASDALLGADLLLGMQIGDTAYAIWPAYYVGQLLITLAVVLTPRYIPSRGGYRFV